METNQNKRKNNEGASRLCGQFCRSSSQEEEEQNNRSEELLSAHSAKIKDVYLELDEYQFFHSPYALDKKDKRFIGRRRLVNHLKTLLENSSTKSGAYLITGFRGMGKTSVVRKAIKEVNETFNPNAYAKVKGKLPLYFSYLLNFIIIIWGLVLFLSLISLYGFTEEVVYPFQTITELFLSVSLRVTFTPLKNDWFNALAALITWLLVFPIIPFLLDGIIHLWETSKNKPRKRYESFEINLSQENINELDILKQIAGELFAYWNDQFNNKSLIEQRSIYFIWLFLWKIVRVAQPKQKQAIYEGLLDLNNRINAQVTKQKERQEEGSLTFSFNIGKINLPFIRKTQKDALSYPIASNKEIEQDLINLLRKIESLRKPPHTLNWVQKLLYSSRIPPAFVFVIDELDKIVPNSSSTILERESADPYFDPTDSNTLNIVRQRQEAVGNLLANLKGFLNVAMAKFIFIGGREMYDASLADIADRDSFYSSIFNDVIYVNSFFKDKLYKRAGITRMTEAYLVEVLLPKSFIIEHQGEINIQLGLVGKNIETVKENAPLTDQQKEMYYSLKVYSLYVAKRIFPNLSLRNYQETIRSRPSEGYRPIKIARLMKVIFLLQQYIIYLTYRSNGSPKKLSTLIENLVVPGDNYFLSAKRKSKYLIIETGDKTQKPADRLFLRFNYTMQFEVGLMADVYRPYMIANSRFLKLLGDKILFSSAFIMDHLLKFHSFSFSQRNLELIPEVILVNKEPNLRLYIDQLLNYLQEGYLRSTLTSLFDYKFNSLIAIELRYLSKISELGSAAFNFTLDESLQIKRHYKRKLQELEKKYDEYQPIPHDNQFIHSISFIQNILGDLHYYDQEFDEAIIFYNEAIQTLRLPGPAEKKLTRHQFFLWVRRKLKAALTLEQIGAFDSAYSYYRNLIIAISERTDKLRDKGKPTTGTGNRARKYDPSDFQYIQLLYTPHIAKLALLEKYRFDGFTYLVLCKNEEEVNFLLGIDHKRGDQKLIPNEQLHYKGKEAAQVRLATLKTDYLNNVGNLLYFKNKLFPESMAEFKESPKFQKLLDKIGDPDSPDFRPSLEAYNTYFRALELLTNSHWREDVAAPQFGLSVWEKCFQLCEGEHLHKTNSFKLLYFAHLLSNLGNTVLTFITEKTTSFEAEVLNSEAWLPTYSVPQKSGQSASTFLPLIRNINAPEKDWSITDVLVLYVLSGRFFRKANQLQGYSFQLRKILYAFKDYLQIAGWNKLPPDETIILKYCQELAMEVVRSTSWNNDITNRPQILKYRDVLNIHLQDRKTRLSGLLDNISGMYPVKEAIILVESIRLKLTPKDTVRPNLSFVSGYGTISNKFIRMQELRYLSDFYYQLFRNELKESKHHDREGQKPYSQSEEDKPSIEKRIKDLFETSFQSAAERATEAREEREDSFETSSQSADHHFIPTQEPRKLKEWYYDPVLQAISGVKSKLFKTGNAKGLKPTSQETLQFITAESIACKHEVIKILNIYTPGYIAGYNFLASAHFKMARWCRFLENMYFLEKELDNSTKIYQSTMDRLGDQIGNHNLIYLDSNQHFELAIQYYHKAIQLHSEGRTYRIETRKQFFLEDDYNDHLKHFCAAIERYRMNTGIMRGKVHNLREISQDNSILYEYENYFPRDRKPSSP